MGEISKVLPPIWEFNGDGEGVTPGLPPIVPILKQRGRWWHSMEKGVPRWSSAGRCRLVRINWIWITFPFCGKSLRRWSNRESWRFCHIWWIRKFRDYISAHMGPRRIGVDAPYGWGGIALSILTLKLYLSPLYPPSSMAEPWTVYLGR